MRLIKNKKYNMYGIPDAHFISLCSVGDTLHYKDYLEYKDSPIKAIVGDGAIVEENYRSMLVRWIDMIELRKE